MMRKIKTLVLTQLSQDQIDRIPSYMDVTLASQQELKEELIKEAEVIIGKPPIAMLSEAKQLKWLQLETAGSEQYAKQGLLPAGCILTNATGSFGLTISEYLICTILMLMRNMNLYIRNQEQANWRVEGPISTIHGSTFLIIGLGDLGYEFAKKVKALGGYTMGIKKHVDGPIAHMDEVGTMEDIARMLPKADVVVLCLPSTKETVRCFKEEHYAMMKSTAFLANVGRGDVLVTEELLAAVQKEQIAGAILDVCDVEPIPQSHPIWKEERIILTPHISGTFQLAETKERFVNIMTANMEAYANAQPMQNVVDMEEGYRRYEKAAN